MFTIVSAPNPVLSQKAKRVIKIDASILDLIEEMKKTLDATRDPQGVGLAAPQVGRSLQIFVIKPTTNSEHKVFINPLLHAEIDDREKPSAKNKRLKTKDKKLEGCLSIPHIWGFVKRNPKVTLGYMDEKGSHHKKTFTGFIATIIQHEYDHLQGTLFPKRVLEQKSKLYKSHKNEEGEDVFDELEI